MTKIAVHSRPRRWLSPLVAGAGVVLLATSVWPAVEAGRAIPGSETRGVAELASLMGDAAPAAAAIETNIWSWTRFPPAGPDGLELARAVAACSMAGLPVSEREQLARRLYAITNGLAVPDTDLAQTIDAFRRAASAVGCASRDTLALLDAVRREARRDPRPRGDWW